MPRASRRHAFWRLCTVSTALTSWLTTERASAQAPAGLTLRWDAPAECPQEQWVLKRLRELEGSAPARPLAAEGTIRREAKGYRIRLVVRDQTGTSERTLEAQSCTDLAGAAAVQLGLLMHDGVPLAEPADASRSTTGTSGEGASPRAGKDAPSTPDRATVSKRSPSSEAAKRVSAERAWHVGLVAPLGTFHYGPLPRPALGVGAAVALEIQSWRFVLGGEIDAKLRIVPADAPDYAAVVTRQAASITLCYTWRAAALDFAPCAGLWLQHLGARGEGPDLIPETANTWWVSPAVTGLARWHLVPAVALIGGLTLRIEGARPRISVLGLGELEQVIPLSLALAVGPEWIF